MIRARDGRLEIADGGSRSPVAAGALAVALRELDVEGRLFIAYPVTPTVDGPVAIDATLVSKSLGVLVFDLVEGSDLGEIDKRQDDAYNQMHARLATNRALFTGRKLAIDIQTATWAPAASQSKTESSTVTPVLLDAAALGDLLTRVALDSPLTTELYDSVLSVIGNVPTIRHTRVRSGVEPGSRAAKLVQLEKSISTLDNIQTRAFLEKVEGLQRIRGLAGSGKTVVLARKAAYLHTMNPTWHIGVTFHSRSLGPYFRRLIRTFCIAEGGAEPDWERLQVLPSWGAAGGAERTGLYFQFCVDNELTYRNFGVAKREFGFDDAFRGACDAAVKELGDRTPAQTFDTILVDEAQDLPPSFLNMARLMLRDPAPGRLVYAYDELQTLNGPGMAPVGEIFGVDAKGDPKFAISQDIILKKCYRNSRPVLATAHALGFGIYRSPPAGEKTGIVQMFDSEKLWSEIGYEAESPGPKPGKPTILRRTLDTSPKFLEDHSPLDDIVICRSFKTAKQQNRWVADSIIENLRTDGLRHDDIMVINTDPFTTGANTGEIRALLLGEGIQSHVAGVDTGPDVFFRPGDESVTFSGVFRAKGNETAMVYVIRADECVGQTRNLAKIRNRLFTSITRSKAWVRVVGVGEGMDSLVNEYEQIRAADFELQFRYPTKAELRRIATLHRDEDPDQARRQREMEDATRQLIKQLRAGNLLLEELDPEIQDALRRVVES